MTGSKMTPTCRGVGHTSPKLQAWVGLDFGLVHNDVLFGLGVENEILTVRLALLHYCIESKPLLELSVVQHTSTSKLCCWVGNIQGQHQELSE